MSTIIIPCGRSTRGLPPIPSPLPRNPSRRTAVRSRALPAGRRTTGQIAVWCCSPGLPPAARRRRLPCSPRPWRRSACPRSSSPSIIFTEAKTRRRARRMARRILNRLRRWTSQPSGNACSPSSRSGVARCRSLTSSAIALPRISCTWSFRPARLSLWKDCMR